VTALQDWLSIRPVHSKRVKAFICDALRGLTADQPPEVADPPLLPRGIERC